jgi:protein-S-isoprenylcysteine O-methyltransferase
MYLTIFGISLGAWLLFEIWVLLRDRGKETSAARAEALRTFAALAIAIALAMNVPGLAPKFDVHRDFPVYFFTGIALVWIGMLYRLWSVRTLGAFFSPRLVIQKGHSLITQGPYRFVRNPSYTAALVAMSGLGISLGNGLSLAILLVTGLIVYLGRIKSEEKMLAEAFGRTYAAYKRRSWALIPFVW